MHYERNSLTCTILPTHDEKFTAPSGTQSVQDACNFDYKGGSNLCLQYCGDNEVYKSSAPAVLGLLETRSNL
jgi:hypothetical protein